MRQEEAMRELMKYKNNKVVDNPTNRETINECDFYSDANQSIAYVALRGNKLFTEVSNPMYARTLAITTGWFSNVLSLNPLEDKYIKKVNGLELPYKADSELIRSLALEGYCAYKGYSFERFLVIYYLSSEDNSYKDSGISRSTLYRTKYEPAKNLRNKLSKISNDNVNNLRYIYDKMNN